MPSLSDVANQINTTLSDIRTNTQQTTTVAGQIKGDTSQINIKLDTINSTINNGVVILAQGLFAIFEAEKQANSLLLANSEENKTMICWLTNIADLLCRQLRKLNEEVELTKEIRDALSAAERILELVHAREAVEVKRLAELQAEIERCCPPEPPTPEHCYEPCRLREVPPYDPKGQDWRPPATDRQPNTPKGPK